MKTSMREKFHILQRSINILKNWYAYPMLYYGLIKKPEVIFTTKTNRFVKIRTNTTDLMAFTNVWFFQEYCIPGFEINKNDVVIDIGGHIGLFSIYASQFCTDGKIFCYEPIKENFDLLTKNIELNRLQNVYPFNTEVSKSVDDITIYLNDDEAGHSMFLENANYRKAKSTTLAKIFSDNNIDKCNFLKLDCEGAEYEIIDSLTHDITKKIEKISLEYHHADTEPSLLIDLKNKLKKEYTLKDYPSNNGMGILFAKHV